MSFLDRLFGRRKSKKKLSSVDKAREEGKSVAVNSLELSEIQFELKADQRKELQFGEERSEGGKSFTTIGLQRLKARATLQIKPDEEIVGDASKPFSSYVKRKSVPHKVIQPNKQFELVDLGHVTSSFSKESSEDFVLLDSYSPSRLSQAPLVEPKLEPQTSTSKEVKTTSTGERPEVLGSLRDDLIFGLDVPEASLSYHKERIEFKEDFGNQSLESVLERFGAESEPVKPVSKPDIAPRSNIASPREQILEGLEEKIGRAEKEEKIEVEPVRPIKPVEEEQTKKFKAGKIVQPPPRRPKKRLEEVLVMPKHIRSPYRREVQRPIVSEQKLVQEPKPKKEEKKLETDLVSAFASAFEALLSFDTSMPQGGGESLAGLVEYRPEEVEDLNQMFLQMLSNYLKPLEDGFDTLERGEYDDETVAGLLGAVRPLRNAAITMNFERISELLREIEEPLNVYRRGEIKRFRPTQLASMVLSYRELFKLLPKAKLASETTKFSAANELLKILKTIPEVTSEYIEKLFACGFSSLDAVRSTLPYEISITCSIPEEIAYKIHNIVLENVEREV